MNKKDYDGKDWKDGEKYYEDKEVYFKEEWKKIYEKMFGIEKPPKKDNKKRKIVWCLFDDDNRSYYRALRKNDNYLVIGFGIKQCLEKFFVVDISLTNPKLIKWFSGFGKPDIILASPPCSSWSNLARINTYKGLDENKNYKINHELDFVKYNFKNHYHNENRNFYQKEASFINGLNTIGATIKLIEHFQPRFYVIENPQTSKIWDYIETHFHFKGFKNLAYYNNYDDEYSLKPTIFYSNIEIELKHKRIKSKKNIRNMSRSKRSNIPYELVKDIMKPFEALWKEVENDRKIEN